jgi:hypothetical protein
MFETEHKFHLKITECFFTHSQRRKMEGTESSHNTKVSDSAYSTSCNSQSQKSGSSSKSGQSNSSASGSSGYGGKQPSSQYEALNFS